LQRRRGIRLVSFDVPGSPELEFRELSDPPTDIQGAFVNRTGKPRLTASQLSSVAAVAGATFAAIGVATATRATAHVDRKAAPKLALQPRSRGRRVASALSPLGKWHTVVPAAVIGGALLARDADRRVAAGTIVASSLIAVALAKLFDHALPQPPVPANHRHTPNKPVFPSGHAFLATSVSTTAAYVLHRERLINSRVAAAAAFAFSVANPGFKLAVRKHWLSDAVGGLAAGVAVAAACCAAYESLHED
jgi:membrane-associated phospholipid phosphatase